MFIACIEADSIFEMQQIDFIYIYKHGCFFINQPNLFNLKTSRFAFETSME
jgi:hypothetical protein